MATTKTARILQIANDLAAEGAYISASSLAALVKERDDLLMVLESLVKMAQEALAKAREG